MHLSTQGAMLSVIYAANHTNYAQYKPVSILDALTLKQEVHDACEDGQLRYSEKPGTYNSIWTDMGVEKTVIGDAKDDGGVIVLLTKPVAMLC